MSVFTNPASGAREAAASYTKAVLDLLGKQDPRKILNELPHFVKELTAGLGDGQLRRPEAAGKWSIIEVLQHLADSELVWSYRLRMVIAHDSPEIAGYDQDLWAKRLGYQQADLNETLAQISVLRRANLRLLDSLTAAELKRVGIHKERGEESVEHMVRLYAGHDLVHRQQLLRIKAG